MDNLLDKIVKSLGGDRPSNNKEFLVDDDKCFECQRPLSRFGVRKVNCRQCGQVFCSKCTSSSILSNESDNQQWLRVCRRCSRFRQPSHTHGVNASSPPDKQVFSSSALVRETGMGRNVNVAGLREQESFTGVLLARGSTGAEYITQMKRASNVGTDPTDALRWDVPPPLESDFSSSLYGGGGQETLPDSTIVSIHRSVFQSMSAQYLQTMVLQLLQSEGVEQAEVWHHVVVRVALEAANALSPTAVSACGTIDPRNYIKVKKLADVGQGPEESTVVYGVCCKKNVPHRRMRSKIETPKIILLGGALESQRRNNELSSFSTMLDQDKDYLLKRVNDIAVLKPDVVLVGGSVARVAQEELLAKNISIVLNVKSKLLDRLARVMGIKVCPTVDQLKELRESVIGRCKEFRVDTIHPPTHPTSASSLNLSRTASLSEVSPPSAAGSSTPPTATSTSANPSNPAPAVSASAVAAALSSAPSRREGSLPAPPGSRTLMFFEGCPLQLGCCILLKGASAEQLVKVKQVARFAAYAAYHHRLENAFLADGMATALAATAQEYIKQEDICNSLAKATIKASADTASSGDGQSISISPHISEWRCLPRIEMSPPPSVLMQSQDLTSTAADLPPLPPLPPNRANTPPLPTLQIPAFQPPSFVSPAGSSAPLLSPNQLPSAPLGNTPAGTPVASGPAPSLPSLSAAVTAVASSPAALGHARSSSVDGGSLSRLAVVTSASSAPSTTGGAGAARVGGAGAAVGASGEAASLLPSTPRAGGAAGSGVMGSPQQASGEGSAARASSDWGGAVAVGTDGAGVVDEAQYADPLLAPLEAEKKRRKEEEEARRRQEEEEEEEDRREALVAAAAAAAQQEQQQQQQQQREQEAAATSGQPQSQAKPQGQQQKPPSRPSSPLGVDVDSFDEPLESSGVAEGSSIMGYSPGPLSRSSSTVSTSGRQPVLDYSHFADEVYTHQRIFVSRASRNEVRKHPRQGMMCEAYSIHRYDFYSSRDFSLDKFVKDAMPIKSWRCMVEGCGQSINLGHVRTFLHGNWRIIMSVGSNSTALPGAEKGQIWMWLRPKDMKAGSVSTVRRVPLSPESKCLSFGAFLDLCFGASNLIILNKWPLNSGFVRYFGIGHTVICLHQTPITPNKVLLPPLVIEYSPNAQVKWVSELMAGELLSHSNEVYTKLVAMAPADAKKDVMRQQTEFQEAVNRANQSAKVELQEYSRAEEGAGRRGPQHEWDENKVLEAVTELNRLRRTLWHNALRMANELLLPSTNTAPAPPGTPPPQPPPSSQSSLNPPPTPEVSIFSHINGMTAAQQLGFASSDPSAPLPPTGAPGGAAAPSAALPPLSTSSSLAAAAAAAVAASAAPHSGLTPPNSPRLTPTTSLSPHHTATHTRTSSILSFTDQPLFTDGEEGAFEADNSTVADWYALSMDPQSFSSHELDGLTTEEEGGDHLFPKLVPEGTVGGGESSMEAQHAMASAASGGLISQAAARMRSSLKNGVWAEEEGHFRGPEHTPSPSRVTVEPAGGFTSQPGSPREGDGAMTPTGSFRPDWQLHTTNVDLLAPPSPSQPTPPTSRPSSPTKLFSVTSLTSECSILSTTSTSTMPEPNTSATGPPPTSTSGPSLSAVGSSSLHRRTGSATGSGPDFLGNSRSSSPQPPGDGLASTGSGGADALRQAARELSSRFRSPSMRGAVVMAEVNKVVPEELVHSLKQAAGRIFLPDCIDDMVVPVYDNEPTSVIAYFLSTRPYQQMLNRMTKDIAPQPRYSTPEPTSDSSPSEAWGEPEWLKLLLCKEPLHVKHQFEDKSPFSPARFQVVAHFAPQFAELRKRVIAGGEASFLSSLCRCCKWESRGGKSNAYFAKTRDDRYIVKSMSKTEKASFLEFAPAYFEHLVGAIQGVRQTCLAKILGVFTVVVKMSGLSEKERSMDLLVMENVFYDKSLSRIYDLKGSERARFNQEAENNTKDTGAVHLDDNLRRRIQLQPYFVEQSSLRAMEAALWADTAFLARHGVMDYSLLVGVEKDPNSAPDQPKLLNNLRVALIDYIRQYTWDKQLETWVKSSGILGGNGKEPTIISPKQYMRRFRTAISSYFTVVPDSADELPPLNPDTFDEEVKPTKS